MRRLMISQSEVNFDMTQSKCEIVGSGEQKNHTKIKGWKRN